MSNAKIVQFEPPAVHQLPWYKWLHWLQHHNKICTILNHAFHSSRTIQGYFWCIVRFILLVCGLKEKSVIFWWMMQFIFWVRKNWVLYVCVCNNWSFILQLWFQYADIWIFMLRAVMLAVPTWRIMKEMLIQGYRRMGWDSSVLKHLLLKFTAPRTCGSVTIQFCIGFLATVGNSLEITVIYILFISGLFTGSNLIWQKEETSAQHQTQVYFEQFTKTFYGLSNHFQWWSTIASMD